MKGVNAKRIAALAAGAVMLSSSAIAASVMYENVELVNPNGQPTAKIVVGSNAQISDGIAAANIASVLANYAYKSSTVTAESQVTGEVCGSAGTISGAGTCEISNEKVTIEITLPGVIANAHEFKTLITDTIDRTLANRIHNNSEDEYSATLNSNDVNTVLSPLRAVYSGSSTAKNLYKIGSGQFQGFAPRSIIDSNAGPDFSYTGEESFWVGSGADAVKYDSGSAYRTIVASPKITAYSLKFLGNDYGIPFCTQANQNGSADGNWAWCSSDSSSSDRSDNHRIKVPFMGQEWVISSMSTPASALSSVTDSINGGQVKLAKEAKYDIVNVGGVIDGGDFKIRLADISVATGAANAHPAIIDVLDANDAVVGQIQVNAGTTYTFTQSSTGKSIKVHVYRTAPGFTLSAKWAEIAIYTDEITLQDGQRYNLASSGDKNYNFKVSLLWKNRDYAATGTNSTVADSLREIVIYDEDTFIGKKLVAGDSYNFPTQNTAFRLTYNGLDLADSDRAPVTISALSISDYPVSADGSDCTTSANRVTYSARLIQFKTDGANFGSGSGTDLLGNYRLDAFYLDPVGGVANVTAFDGTNASILTANDSVRFNGTQGYNIPRSTTSATITGWQPVILYKPSGYSCYIDQPITATAAASLTGQAPASGSTVRFDYAGEDSGAYGLFHFANMNTTIGPIDTTGYVNGTFFFQEDAGKNNTVSHTPVFLQIPFMNGSDTWRFKSQDSSTANVYYKGVRDTGYNAYEPTLITERGSKVTSVGTTDYALQVAKKVGMPSFTFSYADEELASSGELWVASEGDSKTLTNGVKLTVKEISQMVGSCKAQTTEGATATCEYNANALSARIMPNNVASIEVIEPYDIRMASDMVMMDSEAGGAGGVVISVGGPIVNSVTADVLADAAVDFDTTSVYVKAHGSKIVVAGKYAADTMQAAEEFIAALQKN